MSIEQKKMILFMNIDPNNLFWTGVLLLPEEDFSKLSLDLQNLLKEAELDFVQSNDSNYDYLQPSIYLEDKNLRSLFDSNLCHMTHAQSLIKSNSGFIVSRVFRVFYE